MNRAIQVSFSNWSEICDFVPKTQQMRGTFLGRNRKPTEAANFDNFGMGLFLEGELVLGGQWLVKDATGKVHAKKSFANRKGNEL